MIRSRWKCNDEKIVCTIFMIVSYLSSTEELRRCSRYKETNSSLIEMSVVMVIEKKGIWQYAWPYYKKKEAGLVSCIFENVFKPVLIGHWHIITSRLQVHCLNLPVLTHRDLRVIMDWELLWWDLWDGSGTISWNLVICDLYNDCMIEIKKKIS